MAILNIEEARSWARDYESSDEEMELLISFAQEYVGAAIGKNYDPESYRVKLLAGLFVVEANDRRSAHGAEGNSRRYLTQSLIAQLRAELADVPNLGTGGE